MEDTKIFYGDPAQCVPLDHRSYDARLKETEHRQELPGFDAQYLDVVDYILKITHRIWEEKAVGVIYDTYGTCCLVHTGDGSRTGVAPVVSGTLAALYAYPDRKIAAEEVIWSEDKPGFFFSSHRGFSTATNLGDSQFGPATGKTISFRSIADCACTKNQIYEEWLVRDNLALVEQLGLDPREVGRQMAAGQPAKAPLGRDECMEGQLTPAPYRAKDGSPGERVLELMNEIYNRKMIDRVRDFYADNGILHTVGGRELVGHDEIQGSVIALLASFPDARLFVDRVTCNDYPDGDSRVAVRWRLRGYHDGIGFFGAPSGRPVELLAITHFNFRDGKVVEAWELYDTLDVYRQLALGGETDPEQ